MNNLLEIDLIIGRKDYSKIYNGSTIIAIIILTSIYILNIFSYQTYYIQKGKMVSNQLDIDNYVYEIKIPKENKILAKYLKNYL